MTLKFHKYQGAGNDFIIVDGRGKNLQPSVKAVAKLCDRHKGIGADGFIILEDDDQSDFRMRYFNADGRESTMCGNGARCIGLFAHHLGIGGIHKDFNGADGAHDMDIIYTDENGGVISLGMNDVGHIEAGEGWYFLNTGSPHYIEYVDNVDDIDVDRRGREIRWSDRFGDIGGVNVNFVQVTAEGSIRVRTFERGVEAETLACGTGATASVLATIKKTGFGVPTWDVEVLGGKLTVSAEDNGNGGFSDITLTGPAKKVFEGEIRLPECPE